MDVSSLHNIGSLQNISSAPIRAAFGTERDSLAAHVLQDENKDVFASFLDSAMKNIADTNAYISDAENEKIRFAVGDAENTHDLVIAMQKAGEAIQYTVAVRDKFLEAYKEIMQMQI